jgi:hypothetical protein
VALAGPVIEQPPVRAAVTGALTEDLTSLVGVPALEPVVRPEVASVVASPSFRSVWDSALTVAHRDVVTALTSADVGSAPGLSTTEGANGAGPQVSVDLIEAVAQVLRALPPAATTILGHGRTLRLPQGTSTDQTSSVQVRRAVSAFLGKPLPATFATVPIASVATLDRARTGVRVLDTTDLVLAVLGGLALLLALVVSPRRVRLVGVFALCAGAFAALAYLGLQHVSSVAADAVPASAVRPAVTAVVGALFASLHGPTLLVCVGAATVAAVTFLGSLVPRGR